MRLVLLYHGEIAGAAGLCIGRTDPSLSDAGRHAMEAMAQQWPYPAPDALICSSRRRAHLAIAPFARRFGRLPRVDARLDEQDFGDWDGRAWAELADPAGPHMRDWLQDWVNHPPTGGESFRAVDERVSEWLDHVRGEHGNDALVLVSTHAGPIRAMLCHALQIPLAHALQLDLAPASATALRQRRERFELSYFNASRFEASLFGDDLP